MKSQSDICSICGSSTFYINPLYDDRYGYPGVFSLFGCKGCGHKFLSVSSTPDFLKRLYTDYYPRSTFDLDHYCQSKEVKGAFAWFNGEKRYAYSWVPRNVRVLDIGCGFGETLGYHKARGCDVYGVEADENIRRVAERFGYKVHVGLFNPDIYEPDFFDYVTMDQVIEHVTDPVETLRGVSKVLKQGGVAVLSTPNSNGWGARVFGKRWINWHAPYHIQHFSLKSMKIAAEKAGLLLEKVKTITSSVWLHCQWLHLLTYPKEGEPSGFWSPKGNLSLKQKIAIQLLSLVHKTKLNHLITRLFDFFNVGDNLLFILRKPK